MHAPQGSGAPPPARQGEHQPQADGVGAIEPLPVAVRCARTTMLRGSGTYRAGGAGSTHDSTSWRRNQQRTGRGRSLRITADTARPPLRGRFTSVTPELRRRTQRHAGIDVDNPAPARGPEPAARRPGPRYIESGEPCRRLRNLTCPVAGSSRACTHSELPASSRPTLTERHLPITPTGRFHSCRAQGEVLSTTAESGPLCDG